MKKLIPRIAVALALVAGSAAVLTVHSQPALADSQMRSPICGAAIAPGALATALIA